MPSKAQVARYSPLHFGQYIWPKRDEASFYYRAEKTNIRVNRAILRLHDPEDPVSKLVISQPPRTGKSIMASRLHPAWYLGRWPDRNLLVTGYSSDLCEDFGGFARDTIEEHGSKLFNCGVSSKQYRQSNWKIVNQQANRQGGMRSVSIMGQLTGYGFNHVTIDDPYSNYEDAHSPTIRRKVWNEIGSTVETRMENPATQMVIACLTGDSRVFMGDGTYKAIRDVKPGDSVMSLHEGKGLRPTPVTNQRLSGRKETVIVSSGGRKIRCTDNHPFLVCVGDPQDWQLEWRNAGDLKRNDLVVCGSSVPSKKRGFGAKPRLAICDKTQMNKDIAWLIGFMFGDGWVTEYAKKGKKLVGGGQNSAMRTVTCFARGVDEDLNAEVLRVFETYFRARMKFKEKAGYYRSDQHYVGKELMRLGLTGKAKTKRIPEWVFKSPLDIRRAFLRGFFDADGHKLPRKKAVTWSVKICNRDLLEDLRLLAWSSGVSATKVYTREEWCQPPNSPEPLLASSYSARFRWDKRTPMKTMARKQWFSGTCELQQVECVTRTGEVEDVYDLQVDGPENFVAEGFVVHNTRWHPDDASGRFIAMAEGGDETILHINMPAIAEEDLYDEQGELFAKEGELLFPWQWDQKRLDDYRRAHGTYMFSALFQGNPTTPEGTFWEEKLFLDVWFDQWHDFRYRIDTIDPAAGSDVTRGCDSAIVTCCTDYGSEYFVDCDLAPTGPVQTVQRYEEFVDRTVADGAKMPDALGIEHNATQVQSMLDKLEAMKRRRGWTFPIFEIPLRRDLGDELGTTNNKDIKIQTLDPYFHEKKFRFKRKSGGAAQLVNQCKFYGVNTKILVDGLDALEMNMEFYSQIWSGDIRIGA